MYINNVFYMNAACCRNGCLWWKLADWKMSHNDNNKLHEREAAKVLYTRKPRQPL